MDLMGGDLDEIIPQKWIGGGTMKSIVVRMVLAIFAESTEIAIGAVLGASRIMNDKVCRQKDHVIAKECFMHCFAEKLERSDRDDENLQSIVRTALEVCKVDNGGCGEKLKSYFY